MYSLADKNLHFTSLTLCVSLPSCLVFNPGCACSGMYDTKYLKLFNSCVVYIANSQGKIRISQKWSFLFTYKHSFENFIWLAEQYVINSLAFPLLENTNICLSKYPKDDLDLDLRLLLSLSLCPYLRGVGMLFRVGERLNQKKFHGALMAPCLLLHHFHDRQVSTCSSLPSLSFFTSIFPWSSYVSLLPTFSLLFSILSNFV